MYQIQFLISGSALKKILVEELILCSEEEVINNNNYCLSLPPAGPLVMIRLCPPPPSSLLHPLTYKYLTNLSASCHISLSPDLFWFWEDLQLKIFDYLSFW